MRADGIFHKPPPPDRIAEGIGEGPRGKGVTRALFQRTSFGLLPRFRCFPRENNSRPLARKADSRSFR